MRALGALFAIVAASLLVCELSARLVGLRVARDPFLNFGLVPNYFERVPHRNPETYRINHPEVYRSRNTQFASRKEPNSFRVFCFGGSASAGWPHPPEEIYSAYLQTALRHAFPDRAIEVINAGAHAYAAYRVRLIFEQALQFAPDAIVVYSGNNEFLEPRTYDSTSHWYDFALTPAESLVTYRLLRASSVARLLSRGRTLNAAERQYRAFSDWSKIEELALDLRADPAQFRHVKEHYGVSIESIVTQAAERSIPVFLLTVPVNLRDWEPNVSHHGVTGTKLDEWQREYDRGRHALHERDFSLAVEALSVANQSDPEHADTRFYLAKALEGRLEFQSAYDLFSDARDSDYNPFRAHSQFNALLREIAGRHPNVHLVDAEAAFYRASAPHAPGFDLFLDYVHPTKRGNLVLARSVFDALVEHALRPATGAEVPFVVPETKYDEARDYEIQNVVLVLCHMMHQHECALDLARRLASIPGSTANTYQEFVVHGTIALFSEFLEQERLRFAGTPVEPLRAARLRADIQRFYRQTFSGYDVFQREKGERLALK